MPKLPDATALGQRPTPDSGRPVYRPPANTMGQALVGAGDDIANFGANMQKDIDKLEYAKAKADYLTKSLEMDTQFQNDTDWKTLPDRYTSAQKGIANQSASMVQNPRMREELMVDLQTDMARSQHAINQRANGMWKDNEIGDATTKSDAMKKAYIQTGDPKYIAGTHDLWNGLKSAGIVDPQVAAQKTLADADEMTKGRLDVMPADFRAGLKKRVIQPVDATQYTKPDAAIDLIINKLEDDGTGKVTYDTGGETKYGISKKWNPDVDVKNLTKAQAAQILKERYWDANNIDSLPENMRLVAFDAVVNQGPRAMEWVKEANGDPKKLLELRQADYQRLAKEDPGTYGKYLKGWENRLDKLSGGEVRYKPAGDIFDHLPADYLMQVSKNADAEIERGHNEMRQQFKDRLDDSISMAAQGKNDPNPPSLSEFETLFPNDAERKYAEFKDQQQFASDLNVAQSAPPEFQDNMLAAMEPKPGANFAREQEQYDKMKQAVATVRKDFAADPQEYASQHGIINKNIQPINLTASPQAIASQLQDRTRNAEFMSTVFHVPTRIFTNKEVDGLKKIYNEGDVQKITSVLSNIGAGLNADQRRALSSELSDKEPMLAVAMSLPPDKAFNIIAGAKAKIKMSPEKFRVAVADKTAGVIFDGAMNEAMHNAVFAYYKNLAMDAGKENDEIINKDMMEKAITDVVGPIATVSPSGSNNPSRVITFRRDNGEMADDNRLEDLFSSLNDESLREMNGDLPYTSMGDRVSSEKLLEFGQFYSKGDGLYAVKFPGQGPITDRFGKPYIIDGRKLDRLYDKKKTVNKYEHPVLTPIIEPLAKGIAKVIDGDK